MPRAETPITPAQHQSQRRRPWARPAYALGRVLLCVVLAAIACAPPTARASVPTQVPSVRTAAADCQSTWQALSARGRGGLFGIALRSANEAWAAGLLNGVAANIDAPIVQRWDGTRWLTQALPVIEPKGGGLYGIAALSPTAVWAVGYARQTSGGSAGLVLHWDGVAWTRMTIPTLGALDQLTSVTAVAPNDVWAVGDSNGLPLLLHWNGSVWQRVPAPSSASLPRLNSVVALSANDVWAVGVISPDGSSLRAYVIHWNGSVWADMSPASNLNTGELFSAAAIAANDVWAVGDALYTTMTLHWDGNTWKRVASPSTSTGANYLRGVAATAADDVWAVGYDGNTALSLHWDGAAWRLLPTPGDHLAAVAALPGVGVYAAGYNGTQTLGLFTARAAQPTIGFAASAFQGAPGSTLDIAVALSATVPQTVTIDYATEGGSATAGSAYTPTSGTLVFPPCTTSTQFALALAPTDVYQPPRSVGLVLRNSTHVALGALATATAMIVDRQRAPTGTIQYLPSLAHQPTQRQIVFVSDRDGNPEIYRINADGSGTQRLTNNATADITPSWSPDGRRIAFAGAGSQSEDIFVMNADGTGRVQLTNDASSDYGPTWSPDGTQIVFASHRTRSKNGAVSYGLLYVVNVDGTNLHPITTAADPNADPGDVDPSWSPDGQQIVFAARRLGGDALHIYAVNANGSGLQRLITCAISCERPRWSPDGSRILFGTDGEPGDLFSAAPNGTDIHLVNDNFSTGWAGAWSLDGREVVYSDTGNLFVTRLDQRQPRMLTMNARHNYQPAWSR